MSEFLNKDDYLALAPEEAGSVRVNHNSSECTGSSKSLKITRTDDDRIIARCYRCGLFGSYGGQLSKYGSYAKATRSMTTKIPRKLLLPKDFSSDISTMPAEVRAKLNSYEIEQAEITKYNLGWSDQWNRFIFPVWRDGLQGFQARYYGSNPEEPKYVTRYKDSGDLWVYLPCRNPLVLPVKGCVVVEDMLSGIRCAEYTNALVIFGVDMGTSALNYIAEQGHRKTLVFLDDDNPKVKRKAIDIRDSLTMVGQTATIYHSDCIDPKEHSKADLLSLLIGQLL